MINKRCKTCGDCYNWIKTTCPKEMIGHRPSYNCSICIYYEDEMEVIKEMNTFNNRFEIMDLE